MAVGAKDYIDQMLVSRYAKEQTNNPEDVNVLAITRDRYWEIMEDVTQVQKAMIQVATSIRNKLDNTGIKVSKNTAC